MNAFTHVTDDLVHDLNMGGLSCILCMFCKFWSMDERMNGCFTLMPRIIGYLLVNMTSLKQFYKL